MKLLKSGVVMIFAITASLEVSAGKNPPKLTSLKVACPSTTLNVKKTTACSATAYYSNGTNKSVTTSNTSWSSNNAGVASISTKGVVTAKGVAKNTAITIAASYRESEVTQTASINLTITGLDGKSAAAMGCSSDQKTATSKTLAGGKVSLMSSSVCGSRWTSVAASSGLLTFAKINRTSDNVSYQSAGKGNIVSPMVFAPSIKSCASGYIGNASVADNALCN